MMQVVSLNVGLPRTVTYNGEAVETGIYKSPVAGRVMLHSENLVGDRQADLRVHGGPDKAVYAYPFEHYSFWSETLQRNDLSYGQFGENFTTQGLLEADILIGDVFQIGSAVLQISQPRMPCFKLGIKMGDPTFVKRFTKERRSGFYFRVLAEGEVGAGDEIVRLERGPNPNISVPTIYHLWLDDADPDLVQQAADLAPLANGWREWFAEQLAK